MNVTELDNAALSLEIARLKQQKNAIILAHYYQRPEIQDLADYVGDSLGLSQQAASTKADIIVFAGVHFMAETAKILNPNKKVLLPDLDAGCSLADSCPAPDFGKFVSKHSGHAVVTYINCSAEVKALSDIVCTSSNAIKVVESIPKNQPIIFAPDKNLGRYVAEQTGRKLVLWDGVCDAHEAFSMEKLEALQAKHPDAELIAHPESNESLLAKASYIGSTAGMLAYVTANSEKAFFVATEAGILHRMRQEAPNAKLIPVPTAAHNTCACSECQYMKLNTIEKLYRCLADETPQVTIPRSTMAQAVLPINRMLALSLN